MNDLLLDELKQLNPSTAKIILNKISSFRLNKQDIVLKLWLIIGLDLTNLNMNTYFYGADRNLVPKDPLKFNKRIDFVLVITRNGYNLCFRHLPEANETVSELDERYIENDWELFRITRRSSSFERGVSINYMFIYHDDVENMKENMSSGKIPESDFFELLREAAHYGAIRCLRHLIINGVKPTQKILELACCSGNDEIVTVLVDEGLEFNEECLVNAIKSWNNKLAKWLIEEKGITTDLTSAIKSSNYEMFLILLEKGASLDYKNRVCFGSNCQSV